MNEPQAGLSIGGLARATGVPAATLRSWEDRYGFPRPQRLAGGHRRYEKGDSALIEEVLRRHVQARAARSLGQPFHESRHRGLRRGVAGGWKGLGDRWHRLG